MCGLALVRASTTLVHPKGHKKRSTSLRAERQGFCPCTTAELYCCCYVTVYLPGSGDWRYDRMRAKLRRPNNAR